MSTFRGLGVAMVTPFNADLSIDFKGLQRLTEHLISNGVDYLVVQGTTGESATLSNDERRSILDFILEVNAGRRKVVFGIGGNNTMGVVHTLKTWDLSGVDGILSVSPYYNKPTQEGIFQHYTHVAGATDLPIILYNVPGRTASNVSADTTLRLAKACANIVAVKEASGNFEQISSIIQNKPEGFEVISGDDGITLPLISAGADGVISVVGNAFPAEFSALVHHALSGNIGPAQEEHYRLAELITGLFEEGNPAGIKACLKHASICGDTVRLPLVKASDKLSDKLYQLMTKNALVKA
jgi:4-hydroxy-tetrahydrodipicolinate synthase